MGPAEQNCDKKKYKKKIEHDLSLFVFSGICAFSFQMSVHKMDKDLINLLTYITHLVGFWQEKNTKKI